MIKRYALIGKNLEGSLSPVIHKSFGCEYDLLDIDEKDLQWALNQPYDGFNITSPYKLKVGRFLRASWTCTGSINTIKRVGKGLYGYDTDFFGFLCAIDNMPKGKIGIIGNGAMAKVVKSALLRKGNTVRTHDSYSDNNYFGTLDGLVNCTPRQDFNLDGLPQKAWVMDLGYKDDTFINNARSRGNFAIDGFGMLYEQARKSQEIWND